jgi:hypothetical protein
MGFIFKKEKFGKFGGKNFQIFKFGEITFRGVFGGSFSPTKTIRQNWSGSSWVNGGTILMSHLFLAFFVKKRKKKIKKISKIKKSRFLFFRVVFFSG